MLDSNKRIQTYVNQFILDERLRKRTLLIIIAAVLFLLGLLMTIFNIITDHMSVAWLTGAFAMTVSLALVLFIFLHKEMLGTWILIGSLMSTFVILMISGGVEGFSPIWILLLPMTVFSLFGVRHGAILNGLMLSIIIIVLWTPLFSGIRYSYDPTFIIRFPIVYLTSMLLGAIIEWERYLTHMKLNESRGRLLYLSHIDELTKLENRRSFNQRLLQYWEDAIETSSPISAMMIDIDCFKLYNDHYGHMAGDSVLIEAAQCISGVLPDSSDVVARWGGEEFVVLLPNTSSDAAMDIAKNILESIEERDIPHEKARLPEKRITASIGIATIIPNTSNTSTDLLTRADKALYIAKSNGGNQFSY